MDVIKRSGEPQKFDRNKIVEAIKAAFKEVDGEVTSSANQQAYRISKDVERIVAEVGELSVEEIQDIVEEKLMASKRKDVARAYVRYRFLHEIHRLHSAKDEYDNKIKEKLMASNVQNQNANIDEHSFGGRMGEVTDEVLRNFALDYCMSDMAKQNHINNRIYIHDLNSYAVGMHNCLSVPFDKLLADGFNTRQTDVRPANSVNTAFQLVAVIFQLQSLMQFGGVSATHLDWTMVPYVRKSFIKHYKTGMKYFHDLDDKYLESYHWIDNRIEEGIEADCYKNDKKVYKYALDMTKKETHQAVEGMYHNLNTLQSRSGNQLPFTSINYGTCTLPEGRMVTEALLNVSIEGLGALHRTSIFPCGIFQCKKGINRKPGDPNYDLFKLALKSTALRLYPNYFNCDWSNQIAAINNDRNMRRKVISELEPIQYEKLKEILKNDPKLDEKLKLYVEDENIVVNDLEDVSEMGSTMGCRTWNGDDITYINTFKSNIESVIKSGVLKNDTYLSAAQKDGRGNICPVTIILPTIAMETKEKYPNVSEEELVEYFIKYLDSKIYEARDMLLERYNWICAQSASSAKFMWENNTMEGYIPEEGVRSAIQHGTLAIGQLDLATALRILIGVDQTTEKGMEVGKRIEKLFYDRARQFKQDFQLNFCSYLTPAESLCFTALKKFRSKYGIIEGISDKEYFTNSIHVPVWIELTPFEKIDIESQLTGFSNAGCITYTELGSTVKNNLDALETIVNYAMDKDIPYFAINVPNDTCLECGYCDEFNDHCPQCGSEHIQQLRRVTGYLTGDYKTAFNTGKQAETEERKKSLK